MNERSNVGSITSTKIGIVSREISIVLIDLKSFFFTVKCQTQGRRLPLESMVIMMILFI